MKCLIVGAGITAFCDVANPDRRPPLVKAEDFRRILDKPDPYSFASSESAQGHLRPFWFWAFTNFSDDIEKLFTCLYFISLLPDYNTIISDAQRVLPDDELKPLIITVAQQMRRDNILLKPRNIIELMYDMIRSELYICIGTTGWIIGTRFHYLRNMLQSQAGFHKEIP